MNRQHSTIRCELEALAIALASAIDMLGNVACIGKRTLVEMCSKV